MYTRRSIPVRSRFSASRRRRRRRRRRKPRCFRFSLAKRVSATGTCARENTSINCHEFPRAGYLPSRLAIPASFTGMLHLLYLINAIVITFIESTTNAVTRLFRIERRVRVCEHRRATLRGHRWSRFDFQIEITFGRGGRSRTSGPARKRYTAAGISRILPIYSNRLNTPAVTPRYREIP